MAVRSAEDASLAAKLEELVNSGPRIEELSSTSEEPDAEYEDEEDEEEDAAEDAIDNASANNDNSVYAWRPLNQTQSVSAIYTQLPFLTDTLVTESSEAHQRTAEACRKLMCGEEREVKELNSHGIPRLQRKKQVKFFKQALGRYPPAFQVMDASRPWILYWALSGLSALGEDVSVYKERCVIIRNVGQHC